MTLDSPETIWSIITSKNWNVISKAIKKNNKVYNGRFPEIFKEFRTVYNYSMDIDEAEKNYYFGDQFFDSVLEDLPYNAQVFFG